MKQFLETFLCHGCPVFYELEPQFAANLPMHRTIGNQEYQWCQSCDIVIWMNLVHKVGFSGHHLHILQLLCPVVNAPSLWKDGEVTWNRKPRDHITELSSEDGSREGRGGSWTASQGKWNWQGELRSMCLMVNIASGQPWGSPMWLTMIAPSSLVWDDSTS